MGAAAPRCSGIAENRALPTAFALSGSFGRSTAGPRGASVCPDASPFAGVASYGGVALGRPAARHGRRDGHVAPSCRHHRKRLRRTDCGQGAQTRARGNQVDITLISKTTTHLFQPLLYQVATGILSEGDIAPTTRLILRKQKNVRVLWGDVSAIDLTARTVTSHLMGMDTVTPYDSLIVAAGPSSPISATTSTPRSRRE